MIAIKNSTDSQSDSSSVISRGDSALEHSRHSTTCTIPRRAESRKGSLKQLSDHALLSRLSKLRGAERSVLVKILRYLNEVERRRLYLPRGYSSLYDFCADYLSYSRTAAARRIHAARCIEKFPRIAGLLGSGELTLTAVAMISGIIDNKNSREIIENIRGKSTREVQMLISRHKPGFMLRDRVRPICLMVPAENRGSFGADRSADVPVGHTNSSRISGAGKNVGQAIDNKPDINRGVREEDSRIDRDDTAQTGGSPKPDSGADARGAMVPEEIERVFVTHKFKLEFAVDPEFMEKLARIRSLLSTRYPKGLDFQTLFDILMTEYLGRHDPGERIRRRNERKRRRVHNKDGDGTASGVTGNSSRCAKRSDRAGGEGGSTRKGRNGRSQAAGNRGNAARIEGHPGRRSDECTRGEEDSDTRSRYIPRDIRDEVFERDGGRCTFVGPDGTRCDSRWNLHVDHIIPYAKGGGNSPENLRVLCARHNNLEAERAFGEEHMKRYSREK